MMSSLPRCVRRIRPVLLLAAIVWLSSSVALAEEAWEREVERNKREQERQMQSAARTGKGMANVVRRYKQRVAVEDNALHRYLLGRAYWYGAKERMELRQMKRQALTETDKAFIEREIGRAINEMNTALQKNPNFYFSVLALAIIEMSRNDIKAAEGHVAHLRRLKPELPEGIRLHAQLLLARGDVRGVEPAMKRLLAKDPRDEEARRLLLAVYGHEEKWAEALPHVDQLLSAHPRDPDMRLMKIDALMGLERWPAAEKEILPLLREVGKHPAALMLLRRLVDLYVAMDDWPKAISVMNRMKTMAPNDWRVRGMLVEGLMTTQDWTSALAELEDIDKTLEPKARAAFAPMFLWQKGVVLANLKRFEEAYETLDRLNEMRRAAAQEAARKQGNEGERLVGGGDVLHVLDLMQQVLAELKRHEERLGILKRMVPLVRDPAKRGELQKFADSLEQALAQRSAIPETPKGPIWSQDSFSDLLERCVHPDVEVRRKALFEYYQAEVPFVDAVVYRRYDPDVEPDEECRIWVVRILGKYQVGDADAEVVRDAARYVGLALEDPASGVRKVAAEELARIGTPAGILYLMPHLSLIKLDPLPTDEAARKDLEEEYNSARLAMSKLTGQPDTEIGEPTWVPLDKTPANREGWRLWLETPEGVAARRRALADIATITEIDPRWQLRYALQDLVRAAPDEIAMETYRVLRDSIRRIGPEAIEKDPWWRTFPMIEDADVNAKTVEEIRTKIRDWWASLKKDAR